jgi:UDP-glucose 4-epimerase
VHDVVSALDVVSEKDGCVGKVINIGNDEEVAIEELAKKIVRITGSKSPIQHVPYDQAFPGGGFEDMKRRVPSLERIRTLTGWEPRKSLDEIIRDVVADKRQYLGI